MLGLSLVMFFVWWLGFGQAPFAAKSLGHSAFYHAMTLLVVASPCALVLSIPSAVLAAIAWSARHGILFRGGAAVEKLAAVNTVALDKTGTLTTGELRVETVESFPPGREARSRSACLLPRTPFDAPAGARHHPSRQTTGPATAGVGALRIHHRPGPARPPEWRRLPAGPPRMAGPGPTRRGVIAQVPPTDPGFAEIWLAEDGLLGRLVLRDDIRPEARELVDELHREGLRAVVLTGDRTATAEHLRRELGIQDVRAELKPEEKLAAIRSLTQQGEARRDGRRRRQRRPEPGRRHIGVAMGARGSDAALEQADVVLMHDRLENFLAAFRLSQRARRIIRQNLIISLGTVVVLVTFAILGRIPLTVGVVGHEGSTVIVVMNSLRLLFGAARPEA